MVRFSSAVLMRVHRFLLEIHAIGDVETQRRVVPAGLAQLIGCDRSALNDIDTSDRRSIIPSPVPSYWHRLGPVLLEHLQEHPLSGLIAEPPLHIPATFSDWRHDPIWRKSTLYHEYYLPIGATHQLGVLFLEKGTRRLSLNCNRQHRDFSAADRALMGLVSRHVECAWRNATKLVELRTRVHPQNETDVNAELEHAIVVDAEGRVVGTTSPGVRDVARRFFHETLAEGRILPDALRRWAAAARQRLASPDSLGSPPEPLRVRNATSSLVARLGQTDPEFAVVLLSEKMDAAIPAELPVTLLTRRELEIATWLREGKRNAEIGAILGISTRTVGKHVEHIFEKLGVETRTAAAQALMARRGEN